MSASIVQILEGVASAAWRRAVALSAAGSGLPSHGMRRNLPASVLLELSDGSVHRLNVRGATLTPDLVGDLAEAVLRVRAGMVTLHGPLNDWIREVMSMPSAELTSATPEDLTPANWSIRPWAVALVLHEHEAAGANEAAVRTQMIAIEATLVQALNGFRSGLDQDALRMSETYPKPVAGDAYSYLASPAHRRNRLQLGSQFPCLVPLVGAESGNSEWSLLRIANDRGHSVIDSAAHLLGVQPSTIRALRSAPADLLLNRDLPAGVIRMLDLCRPESRPNDVAAWRRLRDTLAAAEEGFGPLQTTFLTRTVVRATLHRHGKRMALEPGQVPDGAVRALEDARRAILTSAEAERARLAFRSSKSSSPAPSVLSGHAADRWLAERFSTKQLVALADAWRMAWEEARSADAPSHEFADGQRYWSLISGEFRASNGLFIAPVSSPAALRTVGELQDLCLAKSHFAQYDRACRQGHAYLVVVRQGQGRILSTARIELASTGGELVVRVVEHQGQANGPPPVGCVAALAELDSHIRTSEAAQCHLELGLKLQRARRSSRPRELASMVESGTQIKALQTALGEALVVEVVGHCVEAMRRSKS